VRTSQRLARLCYPRGTAAVLPPPRLNPRDLCCHVPSPSYAELEPPPALRASVAFFWTLQPDGSPHRITPDGAMDLMVDLDRRAALVVGGRDAPLCTRRTRPMRLWGVRFRLGAARAALGVSPRALLNGDAPLDALCGPLERALRARLDAEPEGTLVEALAEVVAAHAVSRAEAPDARVMRAVQRLTASGGAAPVAVVAVEVGVGARQLERLFAEHVGLSPKGLARLLRFGEVVRRARRAASSWSALACSLGYADQAHLTRDFTAFAGVPPARWRASAAMSGLFKNGAAATLRFVPSRSLEEMT
jgi:AraC-like DNA-binding protein